MNWFGLFARQRDDHRLVAIAESVASRCRHLIWQRVGQRIPTMVPAEARGYVRARGAAVIQRHVDQALFNESRLKPSQQDRLIELATDAVIRLIESQAKATAPAVHRSHRAA